MHTRYHLLSIRTDQSGSDSLASTVSGASGLGDFTWRVEADATNPANKARQPCRHESCLLKVAIPYDYYKYVRLENGG